MEQKETIQRLLSLADEMGLSVSREQAERLLEHLDMVIAANERINLTRITSPEDALILHVVDSLLLLPYLKRSSGFFLDMGTGAGVPGIPLAICSGRRGVLLDSTGKKIHEVTGFVKQLGLTGISTVCDRVEAYAQLHGKEFGFVTARAVASLPTLVEYASPLLSFDGVLAVSKGNPDDEEIASGDAAAKICGMRRISFDEYDLPDDKGHRTIICYQCSSHPKIKLPRPIGKAKRDPLA